MTDKCVEWQKSDKDITLKAFTCLLHCDVILFLFDFLHGLHLNANKNADSTSKVNNLFEFITLQR